MYFIESKIALTGNMFGAYILSFKPNHSNFLIKIN